MNDGIKFAEKLSNNNRLLPKREKTFSYVNQVLYEEIIENYYLYTHHPVKIFVYPINTQNELLATYLANKTINTAQIIFYNLVSGERLTKYTLNHLFNVSSTILNNGIFKNHPPRRNIQLQTINNSSSCQFSKIINKLENYFFQKFTNFDMLKFNSSFMRLIKNVKNLNDQEKLELKLILNHRDQKWSLKNSCPFKREVFDYPIIEKNGKNYETVFQNDVKINETNDYLNFVKNDENRECFVLKALQMRDARINIEAKNLTNIFTFVNWLQSLYKNLMQFKNNEKSYENICNDEKLEIVKLLCFIRSGYNTETKASKLWTLHVKWIAENYLQKKEEWFTKLLAVYENVNKWNDDKISRQIQRLYKEIAMIAGNDEDFMRNAFFIINNNTVKMEADISCHLMNNDTYKLQVRGKFFKFSEIETKNYCFGTIKSIEIFALEKVIIDDDFVRDGEEIELILIAPIWEVVFNRIINLTDSSSSFNLVSIKNFF